MIEVVSKIYAKENKIEELISAFKELVEPTKLEEGYILYEMYQDTENATTLIVTEQWENRETFDKHCNSELFHKVVPKMVECMAKESEVNICTRIA